MKLSIADRPERLNVPIKMADESGQVIVTVHPDFLSLAKFIRFAVRIFTPVRQSPRDRWEWERNAGLAEYNSGVRGGWQPPAGGTKPAAPTTGSGVARP